MFRKLVSNLPFSPALIHDVSFYATRLRKEEVTRKTTLLFVVLALIMQSLAVFSPPESANASSEQDLLRGGVSNLDDFIQKYDKNEEDIKDILTAVGITRSEVLAMRTTTIKPTKDTYTLTRYGQLSESEREAGLSYPRSAGGTGIRFFTPLASISSGSPSFSGWSGTSINIGTFSIIKSSGNLVTKGLPPTVNAAQPGKPLLSTNTVTAVNLTQGGAPADTAPAQPLDRISYTIKAVNNGQTSLTTPLDVRLSDVLEYANLIDAGGATFDTENGTLSWPKVQLRPGQSQERTFAVQLFAQLPVTPNGQSNPASYDCIMAITFGSRQQTEVACPAAKGIESIINQLPVGGTALNVTFAATLLMTATYFYARTRQLKKEIRIIRHDINTGII